MRHVALVAVVDATKVGVGDVPLGAGEVLFPVLNAVVVRVTGILTPCRVSFAGIHQPVAVDVLITVVERVAVGVVVPGIAGLRRVAVGSADLNAVAQAVAVRVGGRGVRQEGEGLVGVVQSVTVGVGGGRVGGGDAVHFCGQGGTTTWANAADRVAGRDRFRWRARLWTETRRRAAVRRP